MTTISVRSQFSIPTISDQETVTYLASGSERFQLSSGRCKLAPDSSLHRETSVEKVYEPGGVGVLLSNQSALDGIIILNLRSNL